MLWVFETFLHVRHRSLVALARRSRCRALWANVDSDSYEQLVHAIHFAVNDIGMAFFFALAAKEIVEATAHGGALHSPRQAAMPLLAAVGGMVGPAVVFVVLTMAMARRELLPGWAIPCATDIAFSYSSPG